GAACLLDGWRPTKRQRRNLEDDVWTRLLAAKRLTEVFPGNAQCRTARHRKRGEHGRPLVQEVVVHRGRHAGRQWNLDVGTREAPAPSVTTATSAGCRWLRSSSRTVGVASGVTGPSNTSGPLVMFTTATRTRNTLATPVSAGSVPTV